MITKLQKLTRLVELIQESNKGDVTMVTELDNPGGFQLWQGSVLFPFSGNQTLQIWSELMEIKPTPRFR